MAYLANPLDIHLVEEYYLATKERLLSGSRLIVFNQTEDRYVIVFQNTDFQSKFEGSAPKLREIMQKWVENGRKPGLLRENGKMTEMLVSEAQ